MRTACVIARSPEHRGCSKNTKSVAHCGAGYLTAPRAFTMFGDSIMKLTEHVRSAPALF
jgi:coenzyme F420-reducing hydrogenase gamma subunit